MDAKPRMDEDERRWLWFGVLVFAVFSLIGLVMCQTLWIRPRRLQSVVAGWELVPCQVVESTVIEGSSSSGGRGGVGGGGGPRYRHRFVYQFDGVRYSSWRTTCWGELSSFRLALGTRRMGRVNPENPTEAVLSPDARPHWGLPLFLASWQALSVAGLIGLGRRLVRQVLATRVRLRDHGPGRVEGIH